MTTADLTLEEKWESIRRPEWTSLHPNWEVRMLRKGDRLRPGDFLLSSMNEGEALYVHAEGYAEDTGRLFRYMTDSIVPCEVGISDIIEWLEHQQRDKFHAARLTLTELASNYRESSEAKVRYWIYGNILACIDANDFGCLVEFNAETGVVTFTEEEDE